MASLASVGLVLAAFLFVVRARSLYGWGDLREPLRLASNLVSVAYHDWAYVAVLTLFFGLAALALGRRPGAVRVLGHLYSGVAVLSVVLAQVNLTALDLIGRPINYQWLYYSHFLQSLDSHNAIRALATPRSIVAAVVLVLLLAISIRLVRPLVARASARWTGRLTTLTAAVLLGYFVVATPDRIRPPVSDTRLENPVISFLVSAAAADRNPPLMRRVTPVGTDDFLPAARRAIADTASDAVSALPALARRSGIRNLVVVGLESVAAEYVGAFGGQYGATPTLDSLRRDARLFTNFYAHVPSTDHSLVSLLLSVYPPLSYRTLTLERPQVRLPSLSRDLKRRGYRTGFFFSSDLRFQGMDRFLAGRGFDVIADYRSIPCDQPVFVGSTEEWKNLDAIADACAATAMRDWMLGSPRRPFFAV